MDNTQKINSCTLCKRSKKQSNPLMLQCNHSLCLNCLQDCFNNINSNYIECPTCKKLTSLDFFEKELDDFASTSSTPSHIQDMEFLKQQQYQSQLNNHQQQLMMQQQQQSLSSNNKRSVKSNASDESQRSLQGINQQERLPMRQHQQDQQINVMQDYPQRKQSQELSKGQRSQSGSIGNTPIYNDPNVSNGVFLNSFEISSILPNPQGEQTNYLQNYSSPVFSSIQQSYTSPIDGQIVNVNNFINEAQRRSSFSKQDHDENDLSQQLADQIISEIPSNNNMSGKMINNNNNSSKMNSQIQSSSNSNNNNSNTYNGLQSNQSKNSESLFSRSNSSISNLYTLQNTQMTQGNNNNNSIIPHNNIITQTSTNANFQSQGANQSFSQSFISPNQQSFISVSGVKCKIHPDEEANLFCFQCHDNCICVNCFFQGGEHKDHEVKNVRNSFNKLIPLVSNLKERILIQTSDLKSDEQLIINRQNDIRNLCSETLTHLNKSIKEIITLITQKGEVLSKEIEIFQQEQLTELEKKHERIRKQLMNLTTFSESYDKILNFQGKCSEARMFNYFSDTKQKVNKYISKLQRQNEEIRGACRTKYTSCYPEHIFNEVELLIEQIQIPFTISQPMPLMPTSSLSLQQVAIQTPVNNSNNNISAYSQQQQQLNNQMPPHPKRLSQQFDDKSLKESKIIDFDQYRVSQGYQQNLQMEGSNQPPSSFNSSLKLQGNSALRNQQPRDQRKSSGNIFNGSSMNNSNFFDQNFYQNSNLKVNRTPNMNQQEALMERNVIHPDSSTNKVVVRQRCDTNEHENEQSTQNELKLINNPFNLKSTAFQFSNQTKYNIVKLKLQEMPFVLPPEIQTSDSFIIQNASTKSIKSTNRVSRVSNNENTYDINPVTSVKECVKLIKNTLKSRGGSHSQLRERSYVPPSNEPQRYMSTLKENRYSVPKLDTKKIDQLIMGATLTQKSTERERLGKSNDKKIRELKKILNEGW